jgi:hypothetical protein
MLVTLMTTGQKNSLSLKGVVQGNESGSLSLESSVRSGQRQVSAGKYALTLTYPSALESGLLYEMTERTANMTY